MAARRGGLLVRKLILTTLMLLSCRSGDQSSEGGEVQRLRGNDSLVVLAQGIAAGQGIDTSLYYDTCSTKGGRVWVEFRKKMPPSDGRRRPNTFSVLFEEGSEPRLFRGR
jgi:hypothetical protein